MPGLPIENLRGKKYRRPQGRPKGYRPKGRSAEDGKFYSIQTRFSYRPETLEIIYRRSRLSGKAPSAWLDFIIQDLESNGKLLSEVKERNLTIKEVKKLIACFDLLNSPTAVDTLLAKLRTALDVAEAIDVDAEDERDSE
jgi:hypothetical protein